MMGKQETDTSTKNVSQLHTGRDEKHVSSGKLVTISTDFKNSNEKDQSKI
jgi:hypothetical protein